ncbi:resistance protein candidate RGC20, partial [Tanacetum coccineum]
MGMLVGRMQKLQLMIIRDCNSMIREVFESPRYQQTDCLAELEWLEITDCEVGFGVSPNTSDPKLVRINTIGFPAVINLKSLILVNLPNFVGFFLGKNKFTWPTLEKVAISECPQITVFTYGPSTARKLNFINTSLGKHSVECGLNFHVTTTSHQTRLPSYESKSSYRPTTTERLPCSFHNLVEMDVDYNPSGGQTLFSSDKLLQLQKLETVHFGECQNTEEIFEVFDSQTVAEIPNLRQVDLEYLKSLKYIWKSKQGTVLKFPNLTILSIHCCTSLEYVFTCSMVGSISQLEELHISCCNSMKVIVKGEEECDAIVNAIVVFPCLKSLKFVDLTSLEGFCLGKEAFEFPSLDTLQIDDCENMTVFTKGDLSTPKLYAIRSTEGGKHNIYNRLNS